MNNLMDKSSLICTATKICCVCHRIVPRERLMSLDQLLPKLNRYIEKSHPRIKYIPRADAVICMSDLRAVVQNRLSELVEEDMNQHSKLQDDAMKNMGLFETTEESWQEQFHQEKPSLGDRASDVVAKWGGSWNFIGILSAILIAWMTLNGVIDSIAAIPLNAWDPYPFIFLTFLLSMIQTFQAPFIMMTQNRQDARDRQENNYISKIILRGEVQTRHINTKIDHLISMQWKRLLEMQELQMFMFQVNQFSSFEIGETQEKSNIQEDCVADPFLECILRAHFKMPLRSDKLLFTRWHTENSNFSGIAHNIELNKTGLNLESVTFDLLFNVEDVTLDDIFSGDRTVTFRNDFDLEHMIMNGDILEIHGSVGSQKFSYQNGEFPERYNMSFSEIRTERISDFWKEPLSSLQITYAPSTEFTAILIEPHERLEELSIYFHSNLEKSSELFYQSCYMENTTNSILEEKFDSLVKSLLGPKPLRFPWNSLKRDKISINFDTYPKRKRSSLEVHKICTSKLLKDDNLAVLHVFYSQKPFTSSFQVKK